MAQTVPDRFPEYPLGGAARTFIARAQRMLRGGQWVCSTSGERLDVHDPATRQVITSVPAADAHDVHLAVLAARRALETSEWANIPPSERERLMLRLADLIEENADELAQIESLDNGKPLAIARARDVGTAPALVRYFAGWATKIEGATIPPILASGSRMMAYTRKEPAGVIAAIIPWNFPLQMALWKLCPALAAGCTMVMKPAEETPLTALRLGELVSAAGFPPGVLNVVTGYGATAGAALASHPGVDKIAFTGSTETGRLVARTAADRIARISLELGGKSPVIVLPDADLEAAIAGAADAIFFNHGQCCTAGSRLYVHADVYADVVQGVAKIADELRLGPGLLAGTQMGPMVSPEQYRRVTGYIEAGLAGGARLAAGGSACSLGGNFVRPTVLADVAPRSSVMREEIFGPVLSAASFDNIDDVISQANDSEYGLSASVWSNDMRAIQRIVPRLKVGTVWVNTHNLVDPAVPFGGYKQSGIGREMGRMVMDMYTETKSVMLAY